MNRGTPDMMAPDMGGCASSEPFALRVIGDSMAPEFEHGVIIIIDPSASAGNGSYVVARMEDDEYLFRQLLIENGTYFLTALQEDQRRLEISGPEAIIGVVVQRAGRRRSQHKHYD